MSALLGALVCSSVAVLHDLRLAGLAPVRDSGFVMHPSWAITLLCLLMPAPLTATAGTGAWKPVEHPEKLATPSSMDRTLGDVPESEPNNTRATAQFLGCGNTLRPAGIGASTPPDTDWVSFTANAGDLITVGTDADGATGQVGDTRITLVDVSGSVLASDDDSGPGLYSLISSFPAPYSGTYFVLLAAFSSQSGVYKAFVNCGQPVLNDQCASAIPITCGPINLSGTTLAATNDYTPSLSTGGCTGYMAQGRDVVYRLDVSAGDSLTLVYQSTTDASVYLITDCTNPTGTCVFGRDTSLTLGAESLRYRFPAAGTYYLILDSFTLGSGGAWTANGDLRCVPPNDQCDYAIEIPCGPIQLSGSMQTATNDYSLPDYACTGHDADGADVAYKILAHAGDSLAVDYTSTADASMYLTRSCLGAAEACVAGSDATGSGGTESLRYRFETDGTYYLVLDSRGAGSWGDWSAVGRYFCGTVSVDDERSGRPGLRAITPNPFSRETRIDFALPNRSRISIVVHDLAGRGVRTLVDGVLEIGEHRVTWDGRDDSGKTLPAGVYFARLSRPGEAATRRIVFVR